MLKREVDIEGLRQIRQAIKDQSVQLRAIAAVGLFAPVIYLTRHQDFVKAGAQFAAFDLGDEGIHSRLEIINGHEPADIDGDECMRYIQFGGPSDLDMALSQSHRRR